MPGAPFVLSERSVRSKARFAPFVAHMAAMAAQFLKVGKSPWTTFMRHRFSWGLPWFLGPRDRRDRADRRRWRHSQGDVTVTMEIDPHGLQNMCLPMRVRCGSRKTGEAGLPFESQPSRPWDACRWPGSIRCIFGGSTAEARMKVVLAGSVECGSWASVSGIHSLEKTWKWKMPS